MKLPGFRSNTPWKRGVAVFVYGMILVVVALTVAACADEPAVTEVDTAAMDAKEYAAYLVKETVGEKTNQDKERLRAVVGDANLAIALNANSNLSASLQKTATLGDSAEIFEKAFAERADLESLRLAWYIELVDQKGNTSEGEVIQITFTRENASTINWDNVLTSNIPKIADKYWEHALYSR